MFEAAGGWSASGRFCVNETREIGSFVYADAIEGLFDGC